jgi:apolipoprotein D and lipocalin family protein
MRRPLLFVALGAALAAIVAGGAAFAASQTGAPQPAKPVDASRFFTGRWYEIARTPMGITKGCVAGTTDYYHDAQGKLIDRDACRDGTPEGKEKVFAGPVTFLDPADNKFSVAYKVFIFHVPKTWWILDHGDDYDWFIVSDPSFKHLSIFTRASNPDPALVRDLTARARALGYDTTKLEFPTQFPPGEGQAPAG